MNLVVKEGVVGPRVDLKLVRKAIIVENQQGSPLIPKFEFFI